MTEQQDTGSTQPSDASTEQQSTTPTTTPTPGLGESTQALGGSESAPPADGEQGQVGDGTEATAAQPTEGQPNP